MLIDSHAHLTHTSFKDDLGLLLERAQNAGIDHIINICTNPEELKRGIALSEKYAWIHTVASTTPHDVEKEGAEAFSQMAHHALNGDLVAVGETGLDYHYYPESKETQLFFLERYLRLARKCALPVVIHCREAFKDFFEVLDTEYYVNGAHLPGVLHCFTGNKKEAEAVIERGWYLSLSGIVTFKKSVELQEIAKMVPLEQLLIETDAPYLAPAPYRGKQNEPAYLLETAKFIANLRGVSLEVIAEVTTANARELFRI